MLKVRTQDGETVEIPRHVEASRSVDEYVGDRLAAAEGDPVLTGIPFASAKARGAAEAAGLDAWDFEHRAPSADTGFGVDDVRAIAGTGTDDEHTDADGDGADAPAAGEGSDE